MIGNLEADLITLLKTREGVTDLVGTGTAARIYPLSAKQGTVLPNIEFTIFENESFQHLNGISGLSSSRVELRCNGATQTSAFALAQAVQLYLQAFRGYAGPTFICSVSCPDAFERGYDTPTRGGNQRRHWYERDYFIFYREPIVPNLNRRAVNG